MIGAVRARLRALRERHLERRLAATRLLAAFADRYPNAFVVEIGANDGVQYNPVRPYLRDGRWRALLVEPAPGPYARLVRHYAGADDRIAFEGAAVAEHDGTVPFFHLERVEGDRVERLDLLGSLSREAVEAGAAIFVEPTQRRIVEDEVPCMTLESLLRRHRVERIDLLVIDTEGHDAKVLDQVDLERRRPRLIAYEHLFLAPVERRRCESRLRAAGYETLSERRDTWCLDMRPDDALTCRFRDLRPAVAADTIQLRRGDA